MESVGTNNNASPNQPARPSVVQSISARFGTIRAGFGTISFKNSTNPHRPTAPQIFLSATSSNDAASAPVSFHSEGFSPVVRAKNTAPKLEKVAAQNNMETSSSSSKASEVAKAVLPNNNQGNGKGKEKATETSPTRAYRSEGLKPLRQKSSTVSKATSNAHASTSKPALPKTDQVVNGFQAHVTQLKTTIDPKTAFTQIFDSEHQAIKDIQAQINTHSNMLNMLCGIAGIKLNGHISNKAIDATSKNAWETLFPRLCAIINKQIEDDGIGSQQSLFALPKDLKDLLLKMKTTLDGVSGIDSQELILKFLFNEFFIPRIVPKSQIDVNQDLTGEIVNQETKRAIIAIKKDYKTKFADLNSWYELAMASVANNVSALTNVSKEKLTDKQKAILVEARVKQKHLTAQYVKDQENYKAELKATLNKEYNYDALIAKRDERNRLKIEIEAAKIKNKMNENASSYLAALPAMPNEMQRLAKTIFKAV